MNFWKLTGQALAALALVGLMACGKAPEEEIDPLHSKATDQDKTNRDVCDSTNPSTSSIMQSTWWLYRLTSKNVFVQEALKFDPTGISQTVICTLGTTSVTAQVRVSAGIDDKGREFAITSNGRKEEILKLGNFEHKCVADLQTTSEARKFKFAGKCLNVQVTSTDELIYVPGP
jgi:hypothetical protein